MSVKLVLILEINYEFMKNPLGMIIGEIKLELNLDIVFNIIV